jgi:hypothetical protein
VNLSKALVESFLTDELPTLTNYIESHTAAVDGTSGTSAQGAVTDD